MRISPASEGVYSKSNVSPNIEPSILNMQYWILDIQRGPTSRNVKREAALFYCVVRRSILS